jgi:hypothetical protein
LEKRGLVSALQAAGLSAEQPVAWADEMRLGLCGQVRKVWAPRGVKVRQRLQFQRIWRYLALAVDGVHGTLTWRWIASMKGEAIAEAVEYWQAHGIQAVVWDRGGSHRAPEVQKCSLRRIEQPAAAPELNPAERVFEELRRAVEGEPYATLEQKVALVERELKALAAQPERVKRLAGWKWIRDAYAQLPAKVILP